MLSSAGAVEEGQDIGRRSGSVRTAQAAVEHRGFALGVRRAVHAARTEYVLVVQHDRPLRRAAPMGALLAAMEERPGWG